MSSKDFGIVALVCVMVVVIVVLLHRTSINKPQSPESVTPQTVTLLNCCRVENCRSLIHEVCLPGGHSYWVVVTKGAITTPLTHSANCKECANSQSED